ncbi:MAG: copper chaperone [Planctomycetota bacterium]|nr:MAG: copper chaperone [Planctomycetota bacterium]REJ90187.1 MAG: copper chaperone [Planctomycetota bacterium]REK42198.1 MAG: copper chaperone [Planctomycetota bacterium]
MKTRLSVLALVPTLLAALAVAGPAASLAAELAEGSTTIAAELPERSTTITVDDMHCKHCAKKIAAKLYLVPGVLEVRASVKANKALVVPQQNQSLSPKALWQAVLDAGFQPVHLKGPAGEFESEPDA